MTKVKYTVEYKGRTVTLSHLAELTKISREILYLRYHRGDRGDALIRPVSTENTQGAIMAKRFVHEVWGGTWYYKGQKVFTDERLKELRCVRGE